MRGAIARLVKLSVKTGLDQAEMGRAEVAIQSHVYSHRPFVPPMQPPQIVRPSKRSRWICRCLLIADTCLMCVDIEGRPILEHILAAKDIDSNLREKEHDGSYSKAASEEDLDMPLYKRKRKSHPDNIKYSSGNSVSFKQVYKTIQALQGEDEICHEDVEKYTSQLLAKLDKMEESLEDYLNTVVSTCRPMTCIEKHRLGKQIRKLPAKALDRVVEILQPSNFSANNLPETVFVNLEEQDDVKLWRVYYYVELVAKTNKLCI
ncbi:uncharacterized protein LOC109840888 isoform X2 [Asparagus officinalis]|uniref:uncharacterized protein LOC109840888 isoform X2 n=1 Tax=Asparagus officinalis TaxID=4686 RepID=UPI00098E4E62|nr:uncharacterized protein LOC109840888 isoform X2 [Asparagus officinalis]